jgi:hypothetical protein
MRRALGTARASALNRAGRCDSASRIYAVPRLNSISKAPGPLPLEAATTAIPTTCSQLITGPSVPLATRPHENGSPAMPSTAPGSAGQPSGSLPPAGRTSICSGMPSRSGIACSTNGRSSGAFSASACASWLVQRSTTQIRSGVVGGLAHQVQKAGGIVVEEPARREQDLHHPPALARLGGEPVKEHVRHARHRIPPPHQPSDESRDRIGRPVTARTIRERAVPVGCSGSGAVVVSKW